MVEAKELHKGAGDFQVEEVEEQQALMKKWEASAERRQVEDQKKDDGFTRFEDHLALTSGSGASWRGLKREEAERGGDGSRTGAEDEGTEGGGRGGGRVAGDAWYSCP